jgi:hypothetical protein
VQTATCVSLHVTCLQPAVPQTVHSFCSRSVPGGSRGAGEGVFRHCREILRALSSPPPAQHDVTAVAPPLTLRVGVEHGAYQSLHQYVLCCSAWMAAYPFVDVWVFYYYFSGAMVCGRVVGDKITPLSFVCTPSLLSLQPPTPLVCTSSVAEVEGVLTLITPKRYFPVSQSQCISGANSTVSRPL